VRMALQGNTKGRRGHGCDSDARGRYRANLAILILRAPGDLSLVWARVCITHVDRIGSDPHTAAGQNGDFASRFRTVEVAEPDLHREVHRVSAIASGAVDKEIVEHERFADPYGNWNEFRFVARRDKLGLLNPRSGCAAGLI
jgi:hypothetical protein